MDIKCLAVEMANWIELTQNRDKCKFLVMRHVYSWENVVLKPKLHLYKLVEIDACIRKLKFLTQVLNKEF